MIYSVLIYAIIKLYLILNIYQQSHYQFRFYFKHFLLNFLFYDTFPLIVLIIGITNQNEITTWICSIYLFLFSIFYLLARVRLVFTKRIIRLILFSFIYFVAIYFIPYVNVYMLLLIEFTIVPILAFDRVLSKLLNRPYISSAKKKLVGYEGEIIGITGSFGKTSTKQLLNQALNLFYKSNCTKKSYNTPLGISRFINDTNINLYDYLVLEFGASHKNDIAELKRIAMPQTVFVTGIGYMHVDTFKNIETIIEEKMSILKGAKVAVLNYDCEFIRNYEINDDIKIISYGFEYGDYRALNIEKNSFDFYYKDKFIMSFKTSLLGKHQLLNLTGVLAYLTELGVDLEVLRRGVCSFHAEKNRLELKKINNMTILDDSFNSNYQGFVEALFTLRNLDGNRVLLTPGMVELGKYKKELLNNLVEHIVASADVIILIGYYQTKYLYNLLKEFNKEVYLVRNFMEGYALFWMLAKSTKESSLLIENDLPDLYRVGLL